jgi:hypothetical protein
MQVNQLPAQDSKALGTVLAYLEESLQPPDLKDAFADQDSHLEDAPPLYSSIRALGCISMGSFSDHDVGLFVFDLSEEFGQLSY